MIKNEIYFATRKTASAHVHITKGVGKVRINNVPLEMIGQETAREVMLTPLEICGEENRNKISLSYFRHYSSLNINNILSFF